MFCGVSRQFWKVVSGAKGIAGVPGWGVTLSADTVNFWSCMWSCGWPRGAVASLGSALGFLLQRKHRHVTPIMTYIKTFHYVSHREKEGEARLKCHLSPFNWCLTMTSFAQAGPSPMGEEVWFTDCCSWLWLLCVLLPIPHSTVLWGQKSQSLCRKVQKISNMTCEECFAFSVSPPPNKCWLDA